MSPIPLSLLPNSHRLIPRKSHPAHDLFNGCLLEPTGVDPGGDDPIVSVCEDCLQQLRKEANHPPKHSLANQLWIGRTPWELEVLTFPEQLLIALVYPRVYVFKLFPKRRQGIREVSTLQRAMRGNVCSYELNMDAIASMVQGKLMPRPPAILASLITVTFIAVGQIPKKWLQSVFRVRRQVVHDALCWLKANNPKYYGDVEVSASELAQLPVDDVPDQIMTSIRQTEDVGVIDEENDSYVPQDPDEGQY